MRPKELRIVVTLKRQQLRWHLKARQKAADCRKTDSGSQGDHGRMRIELFSTDRRERTDLQSDTAAAVPTGAGTDNIKEEKQFRYDPDRFSSFLFILPEVLRYRNLHCCFRYYFRCLFPLFPELLLLSPG